MSSPVITIMIDETTCTDITNHEQVTVVIRRVDEHFEIYKEFIGLYEVDSIGAECLTTVIKDSLMRLNLPTNKHKLHGQSYDGIPMSGAKTALLRGMCDLHTLLWPLFKSCCW